MKENTRFATGMNTKFWKDEILVDCSGCKKNVYVREWEKYRTAICIECILRETAKKALEEEMNYQRDNIIPYRIMAEIYNSGFRKNPLYYTGGTLLPYELVLPPN